MSGRVSTGRTQEAGRLGVYKSDFNLHVNGSDFRHTADNIDIATPLNLGGTTVQQALQNINSSITSSGSGFISIGLADGYAQGSYNVNSDATPTLNNAITAALANPRLVNGGIILILAGTYNVTSPITIPAGITIIGEIEGTLINSQTTEQPIFIISAVSKHLNIGGNSGSGSTLMDTGSNVDCVKFYNLMLSDNINGSGSKMQTVPMIQCQVGSNFVAERVSFIGKLADGSITGRSKTLSAIGYSGSSGFGTNLTLKECYIDGVKIGISFTPNNGNIDNLNVSSCKARIWGTETGASPSSSVNSFIVSSLCNANISNNYVVGAGSQVNTFWALTAHGGNTSIQAVVVGNTGSAASATNSLIHNSSGVTSFTPVCSGNNWGAAIGSPWSIVIGGSNNDSPLGDIFGSAAIDILLQSAPTESSFQSVAIVNYGTYTVTVNNYANVRLVGNKKGAAYPIFNLNISTGSSDGLGFKPFIIGNHVESILFTSVGASVNSVRPGFNPTSTTTQIASYTMTIKDCIFVDSCLYVQDPGAGPFQDGFGNNVKLQIKVEDCFFNQTGTFNNFVSMVLPRADIISVKNSIMFGNGYAASIGTLGYSAASFADATYIFENVTCNLTGGTITNNSPLGSSNNSYFIVSDSAAKVTFRNCSIVADSAFGLQTPIAVGLITTFTKFISLTCRQLLLADSTFNGPDQTFTAASISYILPTISASPVEGIRVDNCRFINGWLQITNGFSATTTRDAASIVNSEFTHTGKGLTLIDFDLSLASAGTINSQISIIGNTFYSNPSANMQVLHTQASGSYYICQGAVQVYANYFNVNYSNNRMIGAVAAPAVNPYSHIAGVVINNYDSASGSGSRVCTATISGNQTEITSTFSNASSNNSADDIWVKSSSIQLSNNYLAMAGGTVNANFQGCLFIDLRATSSGSFASGMVNGNTFSKRTSAGATTQLTGGYVNIASTSNRGMLVDNIFSDSSYDNNSAHTTLVADNTTEPNKWYIERNQNQTETVLLRPWVGTLINASNAGAAAISGKYPTNPLITVAESDPPAYSVVVAYTTGSRTAFDWVLPLYTILPIGAKIISVSIGAVSSVNMTDGVFVFALESSNLTTANGSPAIDFTGSYVGTTVINSTITPSNSSSTTTFTNTAANAIKLRLSCIPTILSAGGINNGSDSTIQFTSISITYRW